VSELAPVASAAMTSDAAPSRVLVVIPALNEAASVGGVVGEVRAALPDADVLVVDDGSTDRTAVVARAAGAMVVRLPINLGVGGAMRAGFRLAWRRGYDAVVQVDGDGQHDPAYLPVLLAALADADVVVGARFAGVGVYRVRGPRAWAMKVLSRVVGWIVGARLTDVTSGFRAADRRAIGVFATHYPAEYLGDTVESLVIPRRTGLTVAQVPVAMRPRGGGVASQSILGSIVYLGRATMALGLALIRRWPYDEESAA
jgi:glycosyltransferase involved in cell wall biosynthesis